MLTFRVKQFDDILAESLIDLKYLKEKCYRGTISYNLF
jgi:hypothetical protein